MPYKTQLPQISLTNPTNTLPEHPGEHAEAAWWRCRRYLLRPVSQTRPNHISPNKTDIHLVAPVFSASNAVNAASVAASCVVVLARYRLDPLDILDTLLLLDGFAYLPRPVIDSLGRGISRVGTSRARWVILLYFICFSMLYMPI